MAKPQIHNQATYMSPRRGCVARRSSTVRRWTLVAALVLVLTGHLLGGSGGLLQPWEPHLHVELPLARRNHSPELPPARRNHSPKLPLVRRNDSYCDEVAAASLRIAIVVFAWRRVTSLQRTVKSLLVAEYCGHEVSLILIFDAKPAEAAVTFARSVRWPHGLSRVVVEPEARGIRGMWLDVLTRELEREHPSAHVLPIEDDNEVRCKIRSDQMRHVLPNEDDNEVSPPFCRHPSTGGRAVHTGSYAHACMPCMHTCIQVSPLFYWWLCRASTAYGPFDTALGSRQQPSLAGVSLYSPRMNEIRYPSHYWEPLWVRCVGESPAFLFQLPCSWGGLFFREYWRRFVAFSRLRIAPPFYNLTHEQVQRGSRETREVLADPVLSMMRMHACMHASCTCMSSHVDVHIEMERERERERERDRERWRESERERERERSLHVQCRCSATPSYRLPTHAPQPGRVRGSAS